MSAFTQQVIDDLLEHLDALDVLELIDYHPESFQREGDAVFSLCPISQDHSGRYLRVDLKTKEFRSEPPNMPPQSGNLIDLFARCHHLSYEDAVQRLADEFGVMLLDAEAEENPEKLFEDAESFLTAGKTAPEGRARNIEEADKRFRRLIEMDADRARAQQGLFELRLLDRNVLELVPTAHALFEVYEKGKNWEELATAARGFLEILPDDMDVREKLAGALEKSGDRQGAINEYMMLADLAEQHEQLEKALQVYRHVQGFAADLMDTTPMIVNLLTMRGRGGEAVKEVLAQADVLKGEKKYRDAARQLSIVLDLKPDAHEQRLAIIDLLILDGLDDKSLAEAKGHVEALLSSKKPEMAAEALSYLTAERPEDASIVEQLIVAYRGVGEVDLERAMQYRLVELHREQQQLAGALATVESILKEEPAEQRALELLAELHTENKNTEGAVGALRSLAALHKSQGDFADTLKCLDRIIKLSPKDAWAQQQSVEALFQLGRKEDALQVAESVAARLVGDGKVGEAAELFERVVARLPDHAESLKRLADYHEQLGHTGRRNELRKQLLEGQLAAGKFKDAEKTAHEFLASDPGNPEYLELLAQAFADKGEKAKARKLFLELADQHQKADRLTPCRMVLERLLAIAPDDTEILGRLSDVCTESGDEEGLIEVAQRLIDLAIRGEKWDEVIEQAEMILEMRPKHELALRHAMTAHLSKGARDKGLEVAERLAVILREQGNSREEADLLAVIVAESPKHGSALERLIYLSLELKRRDDLIKYTDKFLALNKSAHDQCIMLLRELLAVEAGLAPLHERLIGQFRAADRTDDMIAQMQTLSDLHVRSGNAAKAVEVYEEALKAAPDSVSTRAGLIELLQEHGRSKDALPHIIQLARQFQRLRKLDEAEQCYMEGYRLDPRNEELYRGHVALLRDEGQHDQAVARLRSLGKMLAEDNKQEKAIAVYHELLEILPNDQEARRAIIDLKRAAGRTKDVVKELLALADVLLADGDVEGSLGARREAAKTNPKDLVLREGLVRALRELDREEDARGEECELAVAMADAGDGDGALKLLATLIRADPGNMAARRARANVYDAIGQDVLALKEYREIERIRSGGGTANVETNVEDGPVILAPAGGGAVAAAPLGLQIMAEYDFDSFVVGPRNKFAFATAKSVAEDPGGTRNPLFLYSDVGLGKTHLMHAIANHILTLNPKARVFYTSTEDFTTELLDSMEQNELSAFRNRHRASDVLLLDDVQFLTGKDKAQEEFFHIFNVLYQARKQIVLTSDRPPKDIAHLDARLRTRFGQGVIVDIQPPDLTTRVAILQAENDRRGMDVPKDAIELLAKRITSNVRELKGAHNQLVAQHEISGDPLNAKTAASILDKYYGG